MVVLGRKQFTPDILSDYINLGWGSGDAKMGATARTVDPIDVVGACDHGYAWPT